MTTTKIVAHQYICIRALEAIVAEVNKELEGSMIYRVSSVSLPEQGMDTRKHIIKGRLLRLSTSGETSGKLMTGFHCSLRLYKLFGLWYPADFELCFEDKNYAGYMDASSSHDILIRSVRRMIAV